MADPRVGHQVEHGIQHAQAGAQHRHDDDVGRDTTRRRRLERRLHGGGRRRQIAQGLGGQQHADASRGPAELVRTRVRASRSVASASCASGWSMRWTGTRGTIHEIAPDAIRRCHRLRLAACVAGVLLALVWRCRRRRRRAQVSPDPHRRHGHHRWTAATASYSLAPSRSTARDIVAVDTPAAIAARSRRARPSTRPGKIVLPGLDQHARPRADGAVSRPRRRPGADGLAASATSFPAEAKTVSPEMVRVGTRLAALEMIQSGTTTFTDMYYFEEEIARAARAAGLRGVLGRDDHQVSGRRREDAGRGAGARRGVHQGSSRATR